ncbi:hypothetical protein, partial [Klebsiella grimontii]|uniref:hypothetical protein n=1 Tax=Klebsiella grimontii TaxID=2058152 RepID=UPI001CCA8C47
GSQGREDQDPDEKSPPEEAAPGERQEGESFCLNFQFILSCILKEPSKTRYGVFCYVYVNHM